MRNKNSSDLPELLKNIKAACAAKLTSIFFHRTRSVSYDPWRGGLPKLCDRWLFPCAGEIHELIYDGGDEVEMYVS
jgi:hypothetical protein